MKNFIALCLMMVLSVCFCFAQQATDTVTESPDFTTIQGIFGNYGLLYAGFVWLGGYLTPFIPAINKIPEKFYQVAAVAVVIFSAFYFFGFKMDTIAAIISFAFANLIHNGVVKPGLKLLPYQSMDLG